MKLSFGLFIPLFIVITDAHSQSYQPDLVADSLINDCSQNNQTNSSNIGAVAPALYINKWIKGSPVKKFERGKVYVIEFWATWCGPCRAMMPHLSSLANKYKKDNVTIIGVNVDGSEKKTSAKRIQKFVDSMGGKMDYTVATEDSNFMETEWLNAFGAGLPGSVVVDANGTIAWIGHPQNLEEVLYKIINNTWNKKEALSRRNLENRLEMLDDLYSDHLNRIDSNNVPPYNVIHKDSLLKLIFEMVKKEPRLKYSSGIGSQTFNILLITDPLKAYVFGKELFEHPCFVNDPPYSLMIQNIEWYADKLNLPPEIFELGAEAYQIRIDRYAHFGNMNISKDYGYMADMYWRANKKEKAIEAMQKAIEFLKNKKDFSTTDLSAFESQLRHYQIM